MNPQASRLTLTPRGPRTLVAEGTIDSHTSDDLFQALTQIGFDSDLEIDLAGVDFIDSSGLRSVVTAHQEADAQATKLTLTNLSDSVRRLLEITGLIDHLHLA